MIIKTKDFKETCSIILNSLDNSKLTTLTEILEIFAEGNVLFLNVTNREYYVSVKFPLDIEEHFIATIDADLFLKLVDNTTSEHIELEVHDNYVLFKGNGIYKIPMIYEGTTEEKRLPKIAISNPTIKMTISGEILESIYLYNAKEIQKENLLNPIQKLYYVDEKGCITFSSGACINNFNLEKPMKLLLNNRLIRLFKLFKDDMIDFTLGYDEFNDNVQTKVSFNTPTITLTSIINNNDRDLEAFPAENIRAQAEVEQDINIVLNKKELLQAINRLLLFNKNKSKDTYGKFIIDKDSLEIEDSFQNVETIVYKNEIEITEPYTMNLNLNNLKNTLSNIEELYITLGCGNHTMVIIRRGNINNILPEAYPN